MGSSSLSRVALMWYRGCLPYRIGYHRAGFWMWNEAETCAPSLVSTVSDATCSPSSEMSRRTLSARPSTWAVTVTSAEASDLSTTLWALRSASRAS